MAENIWDKMSPQEVWDALHSAPKILGPWKKHEHSFGCDCIYAGVHFRKPEGYWYRENIRGDECAYDLPSKEEADAQLHTEGYLLVDEESNMKADPYVMVPQRRAEVNIIGQLWAGVEAAHTYLLSDANLEDIGDFTRENIQKWCDKRASDFQFVDDFSAVCGAIEVPWSSQDNEDRFNDMMGD